MPNYSFKETIDYFSEQLNATPPKDDVASGEVELVLDDVHVTLSKGMVEGSMHIKLLLGLLLQPIKEKNLAELATSNFLGIDTAGCKLSFDEEGVGLCLHSYTTAGTTPQESWDWLHRTLNVALGWYNIVSKWDEFVPVSGANFQASHEPS